MDSAIVFQTATLVGIVTIAWTAFSFIKTLARPFLGGYRFKAAPDSFAVVTGASDGIGKEFALQLAKKGYNLVVLARSEDKLVALAGDIKKLDRQCIVIPFDFNTRKEQDYDMLKTKLDGLKIEILVNNVGVSHEFPVSFLDEDWLVIERILNVNIYSMLKMTRMLLGGMCENNKGLVLNIGSMAGKVPSGLLATYGASKSFVSSWSQGRFIAIQYF